MKFGRWIIVDRRFRPSWRDRRDDDQQVKAVPVERTGAKFMRRRSRGRRNQDLR